MKQASFSKIDLGCEKNCLLFYIVLNCTWNVLAELSIEKAHKNKYETRQRKHLAMLEVISIYFNIDFIKNMVKRPHFLLNLAPPSTPRWLIVTKKCLFLPHRDKKNKRKESEVVFIAFFSLWNRFQGHQKELGLFYLFLFHAHG